jgi:peptidoglycan/LPS O-acetylase OafA/YrhL
LSFIWEHLFYIIVSAKREAGLANRRWISPAVLAVATLGALVVPPLTFPGVWTIPQLAVRSAIMFSAGALMYQWRDVIPARWSLVAVCIVIVAAAGSLPDYRVVGALPLAYAVVVSGSLLKSERLRLRTDLSYGVYIYAFPAQQLLAVCGLATRLHPVLFFLATVTATLPPAAISWFLIEKPSMSLKRRLRIKWAAPVASSGDEAGPVDKAEAMADRPAPKAPDTA